MTPDPREPLSVERSPWLRGRLRVPGDAALTHLALLAAALARGESLVDDGLATAGTAATLHAVEALGAGVERDGDRVRVMGLGIGGLLEPPGILDFGDTALGVELAMGLCGACGFPARFRAGPEVAARSFAPLLAGLSAFGATVDDPDPGRPPLTLHGPRLAMPVDLVLPPGAPATKAALILAALHAPGTSILVEPVPQWDHAERLLRRFGAGIESTAPGGRRSPHRVAGLRERARPSRYPPIPRSRRWARSPRWSRIGARGRARARQLARTGALSALVAMGAAIEVHGIRREGEEEVADLVLRHAPLRGMRSPPHVAPLVGRPARGGRRLRRGRSVFHLPSGLSLLDRARLQSASRALAASGVRSDVAEEAFAVAGGASRCRAVTSHGRRRIALALLILGMGARERGDTGRRLGH